MKDPLKQKAGRARWLSMSAKERKKFMSDNGKKGAKVLWERVRAGTVNFTSK